MEVQGVLLDMKLCILLFAFFSVLRKYRWTKLLKKLFFGIKINQLEMDRDVKLTKISYRSFKTTLRTFSDKRLFGQCFGMNRWHSSYANVFSLEPWQDWLLCDFIGKAEVANKVVIIEVHWAHSWVSCRLPLRSLFWLFLCFRMFIVEERCSL